MCYCVFKNISSKFKSQYSQKLIRKEPGQLKVSGTRNGGTKIEEYIMAKQSGIMEISISNSSSMMATNAASMKRHFN